MRTATITIIVWCIAGHWLAFAALLLCWKISDCEHRKDKP